MLQIWIIFIICSGCTKSIFFRCVFFSPFFQTFILSLKQTMVQDIAVKLLNLMHVLYCLQKNWYFWVWLLWKLSLCLLFDRFSFFSLKMRTLWVPFFSWQLLSDYLSDFLTTCTIISISHVQNVTKIHFMMADLIWSQCVNIFLKYWNCAGYVSTIYRLNDVLVL